MIVEFDIREIVVDFDTSYLGGIVRMIVKYFWGIRYIFGDMIFFEIIGCIYY